MIKRNYWAHFNDFLTVKQYGRVDFLRTKVIYRREVSTNLTWDCDCEECTGLVRFLSWLWIANLLYPHILLCSHTPCLLGCWARLLFCFCTMLRSISWEPGQKLHRHWLISFYDRTTFSTHDMELFTTSTQSWIGSNKHQIFQRPGKTTHVVLIPASLATSSADMSCVYFRAFSQLVCWLAKTQPPLMLPGFTSAKSAKLS